MGDQEGKWLAGGLISVATSQPPRVIWAGEEEVAVNKEVAPLPHREGTGAGVEALQGQDRSAHFGSHLL